MIAAIRDQELDAYHEAWQHAYQELELKHYADVYPLLNDLVSTARFDDLPSADRHLGLLTTGAVGVHVRDLSFAHRLLVRASQMPEAGAQDWKIRFEAAYLLDDHADSLSSLATLAQRWPQSLTGYPDQPILRVALRKPESDDERRLRFDLLSALYSDSWKMDLGVEAGMLWGELMRELARRGDLTRALEVSAHVNSPRELLSTRIDKRFDALVRMDPARFDVGAAAKRQIAEFQAAVARAPRKLDAIVQLTYAYLDAGRYDEVYRTTSEVLAKVSAAKAPGDLYDDAETALNWIFDNHARALAAMNRWDETEQEYRRASERLEHGHENVSNVINLALFYAEMNRGDEAMKTLSLLQSREATLSAYGRMQEKAALHAAALARHDSVTAREALGYLREHQSDSIGTLQFELIRADRLDEAAQLLIQRLQDPLLRHDALMEAQLYSDPPAPPQLQQARARWRWLLSRRDVRAAVARVGRIERLPLPTQIG
jgi:hypothetical protein